MVKIEYLYNKKGKRIGGMIRQYHMGERGLETLERYYLKSVRMKRFINKISKLYNVQFNMPEFKPVFINKRLRTVWGYFKGSKIEISNDLNKKLQHETLWHEIIHSFVYDNRQIICNNKLSPHKVEKDAFRLAIGDGSHGSHNYKLKCECGHWWKSIKKLHKVYCPKCSQYLISQGEYNKLLRIEKLNSSICNINIRLYKVWKENKKMR